LGSRKSECPGIFEPMQFRSFATDERVFIVGLTSERGREFNLKPARVIEPLCADGQRVGVEMLFPSTGEDVKKRKGSGGKLPSQKPQCLSVKPANLLRASDPMDRQRVLLAQVLEFTPEVCAAAKFLNDRLPSGLGDLHVNPLLSRIAAFVSAPRTFPHQFSGFKGTVHLEHWRYDVQGKPISLSVKMSPGFLYKPDPGTPLGPLKVRMDCAIADLSETGFPGLVMLAGGCGAHPHKCQRPDGFFKSAVVYDSMVDEWSPLPDMPTRRHGPSAACLGNRVYVLGGQYAHDPYDADMELVGARFCDIFNLSTGCWTVQPDEALRGIRHLYNLLTHTAFFGAGATSERLVCCLPPETRSSQVITVAFNPQCEEDGWRVVEAHEPIRLGRTSCAATYKGELVVASGRPMPYSRCAAGFKFTQPASSSELWHMGEWRQLPNLNCARVGGALFVVEDKLYISGGVDEETAEFHSDCERLDEHLSPPRWTTLSWFEMPRSLHAHDCIGLPTLGPTYRKITESSSLTSNNVVGSRCSD